MDIKAELMCRLLTSTRYRYKASLMDGRQMSGGKSGLWCTTTHILEPEVSWENIIAYVEACREYSGAGWS